jgi:hypothetical protein
LDNINNINNANAELNYDKYFYQPSNVASSILDFNSNEKKEKSLKENKN